MLARNARKTETILEVEKKVAASTAAQKNARVNLFMRYFIIVFAQRVERKKNCSINFTLLATVVGISNITRYA